MAPIAVAGAITLGAGPLPLLDNYSVLFRQRVGPERELLVLRRQ